MAALEETDVGSIPDIVKSLRENFNSGITRPMEYRVKQLRSLKRMLDEKEGDILKALNDDLGKCKGEVMMTEYLTIRTGIVCILNNLDEWMKPEYVKKDLANVLNSLYIKREPLGVVCVFSAWNYPLDLTLQPLVAALAAGNTVLVKPSDLAIHTSNLFLQLLPQYLDKECCSVVAGGVPVAQAILRERFDHILYTGGSAVGKIIMKAASEHLTPVTLELGGKNPCYIDSSVNMKTACKRIVWGKLINAGQTCLAPDYLLCEEGAKDSVVEYLTAAIKECYGENPKESKDFGHIINARHFDRIAALLKGENIILGGEMDRDSLYIAPTIVTDVQSDNAIMKEEIFGPVLPIITVKDAAEAIAMINKGEKALAVYAFTSNKKVQKDFTERSSSGALCFNDVCVHFAVNTLPFGGVGMSGQGAYHGKFGFDTFSHKKPCFVATTMTESLLKIRYPPYTERKIKIANNLVIPKEKSRSLFGSRTILICVVAVLVTFALRTLGYSFF